jgi:hypothetical protein
LEFIHACQDGGTFLVKTRLAIGPLHDQVAGIHPLIDISFCHTLTSGIKLIEISFNLLDLLLSSRVAALLVDMFKFAYTDVEPYRRFLGIFVACCVMGGRHIGQKLLHFGAGKVHVIHRQQIGNRFL